MDTWLLVQPTSLEEIKWMLSDESHTQHHNTKVSPNNSSKQEWVKKELSTNMRQYRSPDFINAVQPLF